MTSPPAALLATWLAAHAAARGSGRALVHRDTYLSWNGLLHRVERRARELLGLGVLPGDRVGLMLGNVPELVVLTLACSRLGACPVPLDPTMPAADLLRARALLALRVLVTRPLGEHALPGDAARDTVARPGRAPRSRKPAVALRLGEAPPPRVGGAPLARARLTGTLLIVHLYARPEPMPDATATPSASVLHVTTDIAGDPKGIARTDEQLGAIAQMLRRALDLDAASKIFVAVPLHQGLAFDFGLLAALVSGATLHLHEHLTAREVTTALETAGAGYLLASPATYRELCQRMGPLAPAGREPRPRLLCPFGAGSERVARAFRSRSGRVLSTILHETEWGPIAWDGPGHHPETCGVPFPGVKVHVRGPDGTRLPAGVAGQLWLRSPCATDLCVPRPAAPLRAAGRVGVPIGRSDEDGWVRTGAVASRDRDGRLIVTGREDELVEIEGRRIALGEVAACLESLPGVREADARVEWSDLSGPIVVARVVLRGAHTDAALSSALAAHCARNLAPHKVPQRIAICDALD